MRKQQKPKRAKLSFFLETSGGYIEIAQRIATILRKHYQTVEFYIPNAAMSAGTVLVMSGNAIHMDYFSILGPIDPQLPKPDGSSVPALGYLKKFEELMVKANNGKLNTAETTYLCTKFDPAMLYQYEHARELSVNLIEQWLAEYKFKNWKKTKTKRKMVTWAMKKSRAKKIAETLNETDIWHSQGHSSISMQVLQSRRIKLQIEDFGKDRKLSKDIRDYWSLLTDHMQKVSSRGVIHTKDRYKLLRW